MLSEILQFLLPVRCHLCHTINAFTNFKLSDLIIWGEALVLLCGTERYNFTLFQMLALPSHLMFSFPLPDKPRDAKSTWWPVRRLLVEYTLLILIGGFYL